MKALLINEVCGIGSHGRICTDLAQLLTSQGHQCKIAYGRDGYVPEPYRKYAMRIGTDFDVRLHGLRTRILDSTGFGSRRATERFIESVKKFDPDIIHLHNLHGYYVNIEVLFSYLVSTGKPVIWTLHDCWAFTGHCAHFDYVNCEKWKTHCAACPNKGEYPKSLLLDRSYRNFEDKKRLFTSVKNMTIVTPSNWLAGMVRQSFLNKYPVVVIHNGIDLSVFKPTPSDFRLRHGLEGKRIVLAVASTWDKRKGYDDLIKLSSLLDEIHQLVIVGLSEKQKKALPGNVIGILRTNNVTELAALYSTADVLVNPTYEDNFPTVNLEALACGTPVITYDTGGSPECIDEMTGIVLKEKSLHSFLPAIAMAQKLLRTDCVGWVRAFDKAERFQEYHEIYKAMECM